MSRAAAIEITLLAAWIGASVLVAAVVAPAAFRVLPSRTLAGALVGQVLPVIFYSGIAVAAVAAAIELRGAGMSRVAIASLAAVVVACAIAQFVIGPKIEAVRAAIAGPVDALDAADPRRAWFGRLHGFSVMWMGVAMLGAGTALLTKVLNSKS